MAEGRAISGGLPWDSEVADLILGARLAEMFADGTSIEVLNEALRAERFSRVRDMYGVSTATGDGLRVSSRYVLRFRLGCGTRVQLVWLQRDGMVYDMEGTIYEGCINEAGD